MVDAARVRDLHPDFAVEVDGLDLRRGRSATALGVLDEALRRDRVVVVRGQQLDLSAQLHVAASLGTLYGMRPSRFGRWHVPDVRYESGPSDDSSSAARALYNEQWHADLSWAPRGRPVTLLYAVEADARCAPTMFADMVGAYEALDEPTRATVATWHAYHHVVRSREVRHGSAPSEQRPSRGARRPRKRDGLLPGREQLRWAAGRFRAHPSERPAPPGALHPVVQTDPTGRRFIHAGDHAWSIAGLPEREGLALLDELNRRIITPDNVYEHQWAPGDLVLFDNRSLLHRRHPEGDPTASRLLRRCVIWRGAPP